MSFHDYGGFAMIIFEAFRWIPAPVREGASRRKLSVGTCHAGGRQNARNPSTAVLTEALLLNRDGRIGETAAQRGADE